MHIPDGFLNNAVSFGLGAGAVGAVAHAARKVKQEVKVKVAVLQEKKAGVGGNFTDGAKRIAVSFANNKIQNMALLGGLIFALQMINFPVQSGTSGHLIGAVLAMAVVGPFAAILVMSTIVASQTVFFADGGLVALGANIINMAVIPVLIGNLLFLIVRKKKETPISSIYSALFAAAWLSVVAASAACSLEIGISGTIGLTDVLSHMIPVHMLIGIGEGLITIAVFGLFFNNETSFLLEKGETSDEK